MTDREANIVGHFGHPALDHGIEHRTGTARRIEKLDDVHLGIGGPQRRRMFARKRRLARLVLGLRRLRIATAVLKRRCSQDRDGYRDQTFASWRVRILVTDRIVHDGSLIGSYLDWSKWGQ